MEVKYYNLKSIADAVGINLKKQEIRIIEVKATKKDFLRDKKLFNINQSYYMHCHYFYILCPENEIQLDEIPKQYGVLWANSKNEIIVKRKPTKYKGKLKTRFETSLKRTIRSATNTLVFKFATNMITKLDNK